MTEALNVAGLNALDQDAFAAALGFIFEHSPWVAARAWAKRPFADQEALKAALTGVLAAAEPAERLALIRAHPELAGKAAIAGDLTAASKSEQAGAGLDRLTSEEFDRFHQLNAAYATRFGFPFIVCVRLHDKAAILAAMARRLSNDREAEIEEAIVQIGLIGGLRLADAVAP
jgi:2-oxo-4-hydroxy-4-carboxy-5-ureidoimidazoline decarboxylase